MKIANSKKKPEATAKKEAGGNEKLQYFFTWPKFRFILSFPQKKRTAWSFGAFVFHQRKFVFSCLFPLTNFPLMKVDKDFGQGV